MTIMRKQHLWMSIHYTNQKVSNFHFVSYPQQRIKSVNDGIVVIKDIINIAFVENRVYR